MTAFAAVIVAETAILNMTIRTRPPADRPRFRAHRQRLACRRLLSVVGWSVGTSGQCSVRSSCLLVSNHLGVLDPVIHASVFPLVASGRADLLEWPVVGWICRSINMIPVYREQRSRTSTFADAVRHRLDQGVHVLAFPEGTTTVGEDLLPFKTGSFAAVEARSGCTVVPLGIRLLDVEGRRWAPGQFASLSWTDASQPFLHHFWTLLGLRRVNVEVRIGPAVDASDLDRKQLAEVTHRIIRSLLHGNEFSDSRDQGNSVADAPVDEKRSTASGKA